MNPEFYYITKSNPAVKVSLKSQDYIDLRSMNLIELVLPPCRIFHCEHNYLTELIIPQGCIEVYCSDNYLTELIIPRVVNM